MKKMLPVVIAWAITVIGVIVGLSYVKSGMGEEGYVLIAAVLTVGLFFMIRAAWLISKEKDSADPSKGKKALCRLPARMRYNNEDVCRDGWLSVYDHGILYQYGTRDGRADAWPFITLDSIRDIFRACDVISVTYRDDDMVRNVAILFDSEDDAKQALSYIYKKEE